MKRVSVKKSLHFRSKMFPCKHGLRLKGNETVMAFIHLHYRVYIYLNTIATDQFSESWRIIYALQGISVCQKYYITIICE